MKKLKVVSHEYSINRSNSDIEFNENYFPIGSICDVKGNEVTSPIDKNVIQRVTPCLEAESDGTTIVFAPVSEHDQ